MIEKRYKVIKRWLEPSGVDRTGHQIFTTKKETIGRGMTFEEAKAVRYQNRSAHGNWMTEIVLDTLVPNKAEKVVKNAG